MIGKELRHRQSEAPGIDSHSTSSKKPESMLVGTCMHAFFFWTHSEFNGVGGNGRFIECVFLAASSEGSGADCLAFEGMEEGGDGCELTLKCLRSLMGQVMMSWLVGPEDAQSNLQESLKKN